MKNFFKIIVNCGLFVMCPTLFHAQKNIYAKAPQAQFDLTGFNLQLPVPKNNSIAIIKGSEIAQFSSENFYYSSEDKSIRFFCSSDGQATKGSHYPRTELRQTDEWHFENKHTLHVKMSVLKQPSSGKIIIGQIHGSSKGTEAVKLWWNNGELQAGFKKEVNGKEDRVTLLKDVPLGQAFEYSIQQHGLDVQVKINQQTTNYTLGDSWKSEAVYFKAGNYLQDNKIPVSSGLVAIYDIKIF
ncbi:polysaccharide lyase family 7 protein [Chryseobacterium sp. MEBOG06]|uniref:polysaccharide lyase family 7 protein n=1 Tax=Chryseobacterium sp. MEBOG06 TaxID=2879938 RepID=UPI001F3195EF|nr:polysaccharide lyase family 7 protein [Chryseobacterium sp. MEBOG06]UKB81902.1 polysaccharide lyase family 7 protein [Chryseobacterium sp. MEBOG06]